MSDRAYLRTFWAVGLAVLAAVIVFVVWAVESRVVSAWHQAFPR